MCKWTYSKNRPILNTSENERAKQIATPALFARTASQGRWKMVKHLAKIDRALTEALRLGNGRLILTVPPRHGKSELTSKYFPAWFLGHYPHKRVILASYEASFAAEWGRKARDILEEHGANLFGVNVSRKSSAADRWGIEGHDGGMMTAGVGGPITGKGADLLIIDDPVKNYEEAHSETYREKTMDWFTSTAYTRLEPGGSVILIQTRWHQDDLAGRLLRDFADDWTLIRFPALAEDADPLGRAQGEPLWPERYDREKLLEIKKILGSYQFSALFQQTPTPDEGDFFRRAWLPIHQEAPSKFKKLIRAWDKAATDKGGDYSAGVLLGMDNDTNFWILDAIRGQWSSGERERVIVQTAHLDSQIGKVDIWIEQEPGSSGKESAEATIKRLAGYPVYAEKVTGEKETRARPLASQAEAGNVRVKAGLWNREFIDELCVFPHGEYDDQVDGASLAFNKAALHRKLELKAWVV
jgi:predicted phage terminase large subunit-like protein